jgi:hypothetical protein
MSHKGNQRGKGRPEKARPAVQHTTAPRAVKAVAPPTDAVPPLAVAPASPPPAAVPPKPEGAFPVAPPASQASTPVPTTNGVKAPPPNGATLSHAPAPASTVVPSTNGHGNGEGKSGKHITQHTPTPPSELSDMFETLRALFVRDRANGARPDAARCGICYLTFARDELTYHEEAGFYACPDCQAALHARNIPMLRRQRR